MLACKAARALETLTRMSKEGAAERIEMEFCFAPMEGITGYVYRNAHHAYYPSIDCYYTPFLTPKKGKSLTSREYNDVLPEHNEKIRVVPQILTNQAEGFLKMASLLKEMGYEEVNLNLGCPSGTVVAKKKGAGFLAYPQELDAFLAQIFDGCDMKISVKTRIGIDSAEEFGPLLDIFNKYPLKKLIIHPRLLADYYKNTPNLEAFALAVRESKNPLCYNGDLFSEEKVLRFQEQFPQMDSLMAGRGLLLNPGLIETVKHGAKPDKATLRAFLERLADDYSRTLSGQRDVLFKMKELWAYLGRSFPDGEKYLKKLRKSQTLTEYRIVVNALLAECDLRIPADLSF